MDEEKKDDKFPKLNSQEVAKAAKLTREFFLINNIPPQIGVSAMFTVIINLFSHSGYNPTHVKEILDDVAKTYTDHYEK